MLERRSQAKIAVVGKMVGGESVVERDRRWCVAVAVVDVDRAVPGLGIVKLVSLSGRCLGGGRKNNAVLGNK